MHSQGSAQTAELVMITGTVDVAFQTTANAAWE